MSNPERQHNLEAGGRKVVRNCESNTSQGIHDKFLDCEFNVNPGHTSVQLLAQIKHHVSSTVDDTGQECTPVTYRHRIIFMSMMKLLVGGE